MITKTYFTVEAKVFNSPKGFGVWGWTKRSKETTDRAEAQRLLKEEAERSAKWIAKELSETTDQDKIDHLLEIQKNEEFRIVEEEKTFTHVSYYGYSDS